MVKNLRKRNDLVEMTRKSRTIQLSIVLLVFMLLSVHYFCTGDYFDPLYKPLVPFLSKAGLWVGYFLCMPGFVVANLFPNMSSESGMLLIKTSGYLVALAIFLGIYVTVKLLSIKTANT